MEKNALQDLGVNIITPKIDDVKKHKVKSEEICKILAELALEQDKKAKAINIANCGTWLNFRQYHDENSTKTLHTANFCKNPLCPMCAWRKALKLSHQLQKAIEQTEKKYIYHLILATDNRENIQKEDIKRFKAKGAGFIKKYISNEYAIALEITYSQKKGYHPHLHAIVASDNFIRVSAEYIKHMAIIWASFVGSAKPQNTFYITGITDKEKASRELTKYILKYEGIDIQKDKQAIKDISCATASLKKIQASGAMRKDMAKAEREYTGQREQEIKKLEQSGYELQIFKWINGDYIQTN